MLYAYGHFTLENYHGYLYPRIVDYPDGFNRYSGIPRDITRGIFWETDISGISFQNNWIIFQFGRGGRVGVQVMIFIMFMKIVIHMIMAFDLDLGKLRVRYFHGY